MFNQNMRNQFYTNWGDNVYNCHGPIDEHGNQVKRTKQSHPYSYDGFILHRFGPNSEATSTIYSDRLLQWDWDKHNRLCMKHFGDERQYWNNRDPKKIEAFLRDWCEDPELKLIFIMEYCNQASGYPCWRFDYCSKKLN
jgi:hypothetical protein